MQDAIQVDEPYILLKRENTGNTGGELDPKNNGYTGNSTFSPDRHGLLHMYFVLHTELYALSSMGRITSLRAKREPGVMIVEPSSNMHQSARPLWRLAGSYLHKTSRNCPPSSAHGFAWKWDTMWVDGRTRTHAPPLANPRTTGPAL